MLLCVYRNNKITSETLYEDGTLESEQEYFKRICNGKSINYDRGGNIIHACTFEDGILVRKTGEYYSPNEYNNERHF